MITAMNVSIQQLADKIYTEGVEKAEIRSKDILDESIRKARKVVDEAEAKAQQIIENAERNAAELRLKYNAEMRISVRQAMSALKQHITDMVVWQINHDVVHKVVDDTTFMQALIGKVMDYWLSNFGKENHLSISLPENEYGQYRSFLEARTADLHRSGITIEPTNLIQHGFQIEPVGQGFRMRFSDEDFENYFSSLARPHVYKLLFEKENE
jgi:V/A-type H+/Na+-transporting ATPase subunit E